MANQEKKITELMETYRMPRNEAEAYFEYIDSAPRGAAVMEPLEPMVDYAPASISDAAAKAFQKAFRAVMTGETNQEG